MIDPLVIDEIKLTLDKWLQSIHMSGKKYGVFYKGQLLTVSNRRIYKQPGRARAEFISRLYSNVNQLVNTQNNDWRYPVDQAKRESYEEVMKITIEITDELLKQGIIEIKEVL